MQSGSAVELQMIQVPGAHSQHALLRMAPRVRAFSSCVWWVGWAGWMVDGWIAEARHDDGLSHILSNK